MGAGADAKGVDEIANAEEGAPNEEAGAPKGAGCVVAKADDAAPKGEGCPNGLG